MNSEENHKTVSLIRVTNSDSSLDAVGRALAASARLENELQSAEAQLEWDEMVRERNALPKSYGDSDS